MHEILFIYLFKSYNRKSEEGIFASESWLLLKKKYEEWIFRAEYIFACSGLVFEARQNKGVLVPNWIPVVYEKHNFNLSVKKKKNADIKPTEQRTPNAKKKKPCLLYILKVKLHNHPLRFESFANWLTGVFILQYNYLGFLNWWNWFL